jgi:hypothetical protein
MDNYYYIPPSEQTPKTWTNNYLGKLVQSTYHPKNSKIQQCGIPYNFPNNYKEYFNTNTQQEFDASMNKVMRDLFLYNEVQYSNVSGQK